MTVPQFSCAVNVGQPRRRWILLVPCLAPLAFGSRTRMLATRKYPLALGCCNIYCDSMSGKLLQELHKAKPFDSPQQEAFLNVIRTADHLTRAFEELLKPFTLSPTQYNVLRILRGMTSGACATPAPPSSPAAPSNGTEPPPGIPCKTIGEHMLTRDPDITRLLDRLEARALIARQRDTKDRRVVSTRITPEGLRILHQLDPPVAAFHRTQFPHMSPAHLTQLIDLLEQARAAE